MTKIEKLTFESQGTKLYYMQLVTLMQQSIKLIK